MEPAEAINLVETVLRDLVRLVLGKTWTQSRHVDLAKLEEKRTVDKAKRRGTIVNEDLLAYTDFTQRQSIILDDWDKFSPALGKKKYIEVYLGRLEGFRNPVMHSRPLLEFERDLVHGIVGELRNLIVIYRSTRGPDMEYFPKIEQVTDSFGNNPNAPNDASKLHLRAGDVVTFECRGWDPQGRDLNWALTQKHGLIGGTLSTAQGAEAVLNVTTTTSMVGQMFFEITLTGAGEYHRHQTWDDTCQFYYIVDPPDS